MKSFVLADDMTYFENLPINHRDNTYAWLMSIMQKHIHKHHEKALQRELENMQYENDRLAYENGQLESSIKK